ncbi:MAG TPA: IS21-like element helper ATPase IstB [Acidimicrobiales bacterium]|nr:IS21-like element helper ATPase IstB [Acidimicrobiales bacterium]
MLLNATIAKLEALGLGAMAAGLADQLERPGPESELSFEDRLGLLADREADARDARRLANRLKAAKLRYPAAVEDIDFRTPRGLDRGVIASLAGAGWVTRGHNVLITGATGCGKSFVACALANAALRQGHTALYVRAPRLLEELARGRADGRYVRMLGSLARVSLLVLDDFLLSPAPVEACRDLLEVIEDRAERRATAVASQLPVDKWLAATADPTLGEALLDRLCAASHRIAMKGPSQRRRHPGPVDDEGAGR